MPARNSMHKLQPATPRTQLKLFSGGNPPITLGHGDDTVQTYNAAIPGRKRGMGELLYGPISCAVPQVTKAVKWNAPSTGPRKSSTQRTSVARTTP